MTHRYGQPVPVSLAADLPIAFQWRGVRYVVLEVLATWRLRDRWWEQASPLAAVLGASDRTYFRVHCVREQIFDLYYDAATALWVLDRVYD